MKFEVVNSKGVTEMSCASIKYIPSDRELSSMLEANYKFKLNGKYITRKKIAEFIKENVNVN